ncbi:MAG: phosphatidylinositol-4-phosphate 5-kinase, partial [Bacteroides ovatus]|nr:phosphatidylinositol-4-phosphate 5-kinase [Bacteroides ovatus]
GFVDGLEDGQGVQIDKDGNRFEGFFKQGKKNGPFVETDKDGKVIKKGTYKFGRLQ